MKYTIAIFFMAVSMACATQGVDAVLARRKIMKPVEKPVAQRMDNGVILSVYADGSVKTQSVSSVAMPGKTNARVELMDQDRKTLKAAKELVGKIREKHRDKVDSLTESEIVTASEAVFNTSKKDSATAAAVGALLGAAALVAGKHKKGKTA